MPFLFPLFLLCSSEPFQLLLFLFDSSEPLLLLSCESLLLCLFFRKSFLLLLSDVYVVQLLALILYVSSVHSHVVGPKMIFIDYQLQMGLWVWMRTQ